MSEAVLKIRVLRRIWYIFQILPHFFAVAFSADGLGSEDGRQLIWGKIRRTFISLFPPLARALQEKHGISGGCRGCGASCRLLFQCPHWDDRSNLCGIYEDRPTVCRLYPISPADIRDRNLVLKKKPCGFSFADQHDPHPAMFPVKEH